MIERWCETIALGILSIGREWDAAICQCDPDTGAAPCRYCADHSAILAGEEMLEELVRLRARVAKLEKKPGIWPKEPAKGWDDE